MTFHVEEILRQDLYATLFTIIILVFTFATWPLLFPVELVLRNPIVFCALAIYLLNHARRKHNPSIWMDED